jgi:dTDP-4-amino-4,6-dideoxygalactose transaminase
VTQGPEVAAFEQAFRAYTGATEACAVANCTAALHMALLAAGVGPGDEVITVSHSYIATANAIRYCGARPVFVDIDPDTYNLDPGGLWEAITPQTKAILCVHQMGMPCDLTAILEIAREHSLPVIEDAACAIGSEIQVDDTWQRIGLPHGDIACFSFHPRKVITTGDGGMLTTADSQFAALFRLLRHHGMSIPDTVRHAAREVTTEVYPVLGYNYRMTDVQAAIGQAQLERLPALIGQRRRLAEGYAELLQAVPGVHPPFEPPWARSNWQSYCVRLPDGVEQREVMQVMLDRGVATRRGIMCAHREPSYEHLPCRFPLPQSERAQDRCIILPLHHEMTGDDQEQVVDALRAAVTGRSRTAKAKV